MKAPFPLIGLSLLLLSLNAYSQSDRVPGYIVVNNGDTVRGFVIDRKDNWAVKEIQFATSENETPKTFPIAELSSLYLKTYDAYYFSQELEIDKKPVRHLDHDGVRKIVKERILIQLLAKGTLNLYGYNDEEKKQHFYIQKGNGKIEELAYVRYLARGKMAVLRFYQGTLQNLTKDCSTIEKPPSQYEERELTDYVRSYNSCLGEKQQYVSEGPKSKIAFGVVAGLSSATGKFTGHANGLFGNDVDALGPYSKITAPMVGIVLELRSGRASNPSRGGVQVVWQNFPASSRSKQNIASTDTYNMKFSVIEIGPSYKYLFTTSHKINPYFRAEVNGVIILDGEATHTHTGSGSSLKSLGDFHKTGYSYAAGAGILIYNKASLEVRYKGTEFRTDSGGHVYFGGIEATLGFLFTK